jgi:hypothetical protein
MAFEGWSLSHHNGHDHQPPGNHTETESIVSQVDVPMFQCHCHDTPMTLQLLSVHITKNIAVIVSSFSLGRYIKVQYNIYIWPSQVFNCFGKFFFKMVRILFCWVFFANFSEFFIKHFQILS